MNIFIYTQNIKQTHMALKVLTQIGTDQGITDELYIRIINYQIQKQGGASFQLQLFMKQEDSVAQPGAFIMQGYNARNVMIGDNLYVPLVKEVSITRTGTRPAMKEVDQVISTTIDGVTTSTTSKVMEPYQEDYTWEEKTTVPDLSPLEGVDIFTFAYDELTKKLKKLFPDAKIVSC